MAQKKWSEFDAGSAVVGTDQLVGLSGGNKRWTAAQIATYIVAQIVDSAPSTLDTLNELAAALGDDPNFATTVTNALAGKQPLDTDLTNIAALTTTAYGRGVLTMADASALLTALGVSTFIKTLVDDADAATARATLKASGIPRSVQLSSGRYYAPTANNGSTFSVVANTLYLIRCPLALRASGLAVEVTTGVAGNIRMGLYQASDTGADITLVEEIASPPSTASTGIKTGSFSATRDLDGATMYLAILASGAPVIRNGTWTVGSTLPYFGASDLTTTTAISHLTAAYSYGAMPSTFPAPTYVGNPNAPQIALIGA